MTKLLAALATFFDSKAGLLVLGFLVTTVGGTYLNERIQNKMRENDHAFELYKLRLSAARDLQDRILRRSNTRLFHLQQMLPKLEHAELYDASQVQKYWDEHVEPTKDVWNEDSQLFRAQAEMFFGLAVSDQLDTAAEGRLIIHNRVLERLQDPHYKDKLPASLHGAFVDAHATVYHLLRKCGVPATCPRQGLVDLAQLQLGHVQDLQDRLAHALSQAITRYPEIGGPAAGPAEGVRAYPGASGPAKPFSM